MSNTLAVYRNPEILELVSTWFQETYGEVAYTKNGFMSVRDLYQSFCDYTINPQFADRRLNLNEFAKVIVACKILDIGGRFKYVPTYEPAPSAITRATA